MLECSFPRETASLLQICSNRIVQSVGGLAINMNTAATNGINLCEAVNKLYADSLA